ncbi:MAG: GNAT family N-acetyltransferase [Gammaproteobacteria bacterium]|jgi:GNAT superfamily N-acetyltransferase|nr:GNAT family N-acetyltransferase [Gammaproteobacteria bacterium]
MEAESERIERAALADLHAAAGATLTTRLGLELRQIGGTLVSLAAGLPGTAVVINRCIGLGVSRPATRQQVREIVASYRDAGVQRFFVSRHPLAEPPELAHWLQDEGLLPARGWQIFSRTGDAPSSPTTELSLRPVGSDWGESFARIVCAAFDLGDAAVPWLAQIPGRRNWHVFMSFDNGSPAGTGILFVRDGLAISDFGATDPAYRRRGSQGALLARRLERARQLGCRRVLTETGEAVEGDPQHSYHNILRFGFQPEYVRENYAPPA